MTINIFVLKGDLHVNRKIVVMQGCFFCRVYRSALVHELLSNNLLFVGQVYED